MKYVKYIIICCVAVTLTACPKPFTWETIMIINNSDEDILWKFNLNAEWYDSPSISSWLERDKYIILRGDTAYESIGIEGIQTNLRKGWIKYYFFNLDSIKTIPWQRICDERIILKEVRFDSWEDFERCNFEITYP